MNYWGKSLRVCDDPQTLVTFVVLSLLLIFYFVQLQYVLNKFFSHALGAERLRINIKFGVILTMFLLRTL